MKKSKLSGSKDPFILNSAPDGDLDLPHIRTYSPQYTLVAGWVDPRGRLDLSLPRFEPRIIHLAQGYPTSQKQSCAEYKAHVTPQHVSI
jgi:hypothetical protein